MLATGDMGIGNTTASACLIAVLTDRPAVAVTGRGTGIDDEMLAHKNAVIQAEVAAEGAQADGDDVLADDSLL